jgi:glycosyltransferase involved in cell wall biosynthesis
MQEKIQQEKARGAIHALHVLAGDLWGGREAQMYAQLQCFVERTDEISKTPAATADGNSCRVSVLLFNDGEVAERYRQAGLPCFIVDESKGFMSLVQAMRAVFRQLRPDIIVTHGAKEIVSCALATCCLRATCCLGPTGGLGLPLIAVFHGAAEPYPGFAGWKMKFYQQLALITARVRATRIICVSHALACTLKLSHVKRLRIIYNVVVAAKPSTQPLAEMQHPALVAVGRMVQVKRFDVVLDMFERLHRELHGETEQRKNIHLYLLGDGPELSALTERVQHSALNSAVHFLGFRADAPQWIAQADILLISSDSEGIPTVLLEALQNGTPVVSTAVGGIPEVMNLFPEYPCRLVPAGAADEMAAAVTEMLGRSRTAPAAAAAVLQQRFSPEVAAQAHRNLYREIVSHGR